MFSNESVKLYPVREVYGADLEARLGLTQDSDIKPLIGFHFGFVCFGKQIGQYVRVIQITAPFGLKEDCYPFAKGCSERFVLAEPVGQTTNLNQVTFVKLNRC